MSEHSDARPISTLDRSPTTVLPPVDAEVRHALVQALGSGDVRSALAEVVAGSPRLLEGWAALGDHGRDRIERYAAYRVGYHRGLDALRANGWSGSGYVRWEAPGNRGFLRCVYGLGVIAEAIGETDEAERCRDFMLKLDPSGVPDDVVHAVPRA